VHWVVPVAFDGERLTLAALDANDIALADKLRFLLAKDIKLIPASREMIQAALDRMYRRIETESVANMVQEFTDSEMALEECAPAAIYSHEPMPLSRSAGTPAGWSARRGRMKAASEPLVGTPAYHSPEQSSSGESMFFYTVEEGQRVLMRKSNGTMELIVGPKRVVQWNRTFKILQHFTANPDHFLIVRYRDGRQEHLAGPAEIWLDPRVHESITRQDALQLAAKEAVVVYSKSPDARAVSRRIVYGPTLFVPQPGEWLHTFSWHASKGGSQGTAKIAHALVFQKLWLLPDQMYHDVTDVRTADDAVLTIRLMIFFELIDLERMLDTTHDPIGDFVNAATSDVVGFTGQYDFESFKRHTNRLNDLDTYAQLTGRATQCGYRINKVVFRGYGAADALQQMHDQAIQARTRLQLDRATEQQTQDLENYKLECQLARAGKRRTEQADEIRHDLELAQKKEEAEIRRREARQASIRGIKRLDEEWRLEMQKEQNTEQQAHLRALRELGVDLTAYLTQARADQVIELRGSPGHHVHVQPRPVVDHKENGVTSDREK
jgi:hypothetical protein